MNEVPERVNNDGPAASGKKVPPPVKPKPKRPNSSAQDYAIEVLLVLTPFMISYFSSVDRNDRYFVSFCDMSVFFTFQPAAQQQNYKPVPAPRRSLSTGGTLDRIKRQDEENVSVRLQRGQQGYGFSLRGGQDLGMPLFILRMADGGTAHRDGRLAVRFCFTTHRSKTFT